MQTKKATESHYVLLQSNMQRKFSTLLEKMCEKNEWSNHFQSVVLFFISHAAKKFTINSIKVMFMWQLVFGLFQSIEASNIKWIYWNSSNPLFSRDKENILTVEQNDVLKFVCPTDFSEYYHVWWTYDRRFWRHCFGGKFVFLKCPPHKVASVSVESYSAIPGNPSFGQPVYFLTSSTGSYAGLHSRRGGACLTRNMRLMIVMKQSKFVMNNYHAINNAMESYPSAAWSDKTMTSDIRDQRRILLNEVMEIGKGSSKIQLYESYQRSVLRGDRKKIDFWFFLTQLIFIFSILLPSAV